MVLPEFPLVLLPELPVLLPDPVVPLDDEPLPELLLALLVSVPFALACSERESLPSPFLSSVENCEACALPANSCWLMLPSPFVSSELNEERDESLLLADDDWPFD